MFTGTLRKAAVLVAGAGLAVSLGSAAAQPAQASGSYTGRAYVAGVGSMYNDWTDEGVVNVRVHRYSNATCLWQAILWANGYLSLRGIDGVFGDRTDAATRAFQRRKGLVVDGSAGRRTWTAAVRGGRLKTFSGSLDGDKAGWYHGTRGVFSVRRTRSGNYGFRVQGETWHWASYNRRTCR